MKKSLLFISLAVCAMMLPAAAFADGWGHGHGHGWGHHHHHHGHHVDYYPAPVVQYYPQPVVSYYAPPPPPAVVYQAPAPVPYYSGGGRPSTNGLAGGVIGGVLGYQFGSGDPLATGIGAAAGSYLGNGMGGY
ncbi:MAG: glycine zipper 2TM domain-containing protein [Methylomicrobium sp.]